MKRLLAVLLVLVAFIAVACGDDESNTDTADTTASDSSDTSDTSDTSAGDGSTTTAAAADVPAGVTVGTVSEDLTAKPEIELTPSDEAPTDVVIIDTVEGDGAEVEAGATVEVQYAGLLTDGTEFDSSWANGGAAITFGLDQVIVGWGEGLVGMKEGGRRVLVIPPDKAYGETPPQGAPIPPNATLVFVVDLVSVENPPPAGVTVSGVSDDLETKPEPVLEGSDTAPTELVIDDIVEGDGAEVAEGDTVEVQYLGLLTNGTEFDSSWARGEPAEFPLTNVIPGWSEGLIGMKEGGRRVLVVPAEMGYGATGTPDGSIPPNSTLVFVVDLVSVGGGEDTTTTTAAE